MGIQHNSNKFTLEKHKMTKKASNDLTSQCCLINRPIYSTDSLNYEKIKPRAEIPCKCLLTMLLLFTLVPVPLPQLLLLSNNTTLRAQKGSFIREHGSNRECC